MGLPKQAGFTIIEVMLYLGVVSLLFLIAFWGTNGQVDNFRYSDSARNVQSFVQQQYNDVLSGLNPRASTQTCNATSTTPPSFGAGGPGPTAGNAQECIVLGKMLEFTPGSDLVHVYNVVGWNAPYTQLTGNDLTDIAHSEPTLSPNSTETYQIPGGLKFYQPSSLAPGALSESFAFLRSPSSDNILTFAFNNVNVSGTLSPPYTLSSTVISNSLDSNDAGYCVVDNSLVTRYSMIQLGQNDQGGSINITYLPTTNPNLNQCAQ